MPQNERLLAGIKASKHLAQSACSAHTREDRPNVGFVVEQAGHPGPDLTHHLIFDAARPLIDNKQSNVVFTQLPGDVAEDRVPGDAWVEEFVGFLDYDHEWAGFFAFLPGGQILPMDVACMDAPGEIVGDQYIGGQSVSVITEFKNNTCSDVEPLEDIIDHLRSFTGDEESHARDEGFELTLYRAQRASHNATALENILNLFLVLFIQ